ncbi:MAG: hypothetical protein WBW92_14005, partial [Rhodanobacteraceae bacterium]
MHGFEPGFFVTADHSHCRDLKPGLAGSMRMPIPAQPVHALIATSGFSHRANLTIAPIPSRILASAML